MSEHGPDDRGQAGPEQPPGADAMAREMDRWLHGHESPTWAFEKGWNAHAASVAEVPVTPPEPSEAAIRDDQTRRIVKALRGEAADDYMVDREGRGDLARQVADFIEAEFGAARRAASCGTEEE